MSSAVCRLGPEKHEIVFPSRQLSATSSKQVGAANVENLEYLFNCDLTTGIENLSKTRKSFNLLAVGDAATANIKAIYQLFSFVTSESRKHGMIATCLFTTCFLHQVVRILALYLSHQALTSAIYSITRLHQHQASRDATKDAMKLLLKQRFLWQYQQRPPPDPGYKRHLLSLLTNCWEGEEDNHEMPMRKECIEELLSFFNGDLLCENHWTHFCSGPECHKDRNEALQHVPRITFWSQSVFLTSSHK